MRIGQKQYLHPMSFEQQLEGLVVLRVKKQDMDATLRLLSAEKITIFQPTPSKHELKFAIYLDEFQATQRILRKSKIRFHICKKRGLPFLLHRLKRRTGIWLGLVVGVVVGYLLFSSIWGYHVSGNERYSQAQIIALVQEYDLWPGVKVDLETLDQLEHLIELEHPEFTWIQLKKEGTILCITVKERLAESNSMHNSGSIVAKQAGQITELLVYRGTALVKQGDWVSKGQTLIGGWEYPDRQRNIEGQFVDVGEPYEVEAKGEIYGQSEHHAIGTCVLEEERLQLTGRETIQYMLVWRDHIVYTVGKKENPYVYSKDEITKKSLFRLGKWQCPLVIKTTRYKEQQLVHRSFNTEEAYQIAVERARRQLEQAIPLDAIFVRESSGIYRTAQDGTLQVEVIWILEEPIGQRQQVPLPTVFHTAES